MGVRASAAKVEQGMGISGMIDQISCKLEKVHEAVEIRMST